ncbi:MAG: ABC transporter permease [Bacilli bacterium]|nr:ABC transporter permease [Bacilli bacterium]
MLRLFKADIRRLIKDKTFYVMLAVIALYSSLICIVFHLFDLNAESKSTIDRIILQCVSLAMLGTFSGVAISIYNGKEYAHNTIRNKISCGHSRHSIYLAFLIENLLLATLFMLLAAVVPVLFGFFFFDFTIAEGFYEKFFSQYALLLGFVSLITCLVNLSKSMRVPLITTVILFVVLNALAAFLPQISDSFLIKGLCRGVYLVLSNLVNEAVDGVYTVNIAQRTEDGFRVVQVVYDNIYLNAILLGASYLFASISISLFLLPKLNYK